MRSPRFEPEWIEAVAAATASGGLTSIHYERADRILRALEDADALRSVPFVHEVTVEPAERGGDWVSWSCRCGEKSRFDFARLGGAVENAEDHVGAEQPIRITRPNTSEADRA